MSTPTIESRVIAIVAEQLNVPKAGITLEKALVADLGADSLDDVELCMAVEDEFGLAIDDLEWQPVSTVGQMVDLVQRLQGASA